MPRNLTTLEAVAQVLAWETRMLATLPASTTAVDLGVDESTWRRRRNGTVSSHFDAAQMARLAVIERDELGTHGLLDALHAIYGGALTTDAPAERASRGVVGPLALLIAHIEDKLQGGLTPKEAADLSTEVGQTIDQLTRMRAACHERAGLPAVGATP